MTREERAYFEKLINYWFPDAEGIYIFEDRPVAEFVTHRGTMAISYRGLLDKITGAER